MQEDFFKNTTAAIINKTQSILTLSYVLTVGIGMMFNYQKYSEFGINIFSYSDVFDFLIAPFSDFNILLFSVASMAVAFLLMRFDMTWKKKYPKSYSFFSFGLARKKWYDTVRYVSFVIGFVYYLYTAADLYGQFTQKSIEQQTPISIRYMDNEMITGKEIGKTQDVIFLLVGKKVIAIPTTSLVKEIEIK